MTDSLPHAKTFKVAGMVYDGLKQVDIYALEPSEAVMLIAQLMEGK